MSLDKVLTKLKLDINQKVNIEEIDVYNNIREKILNSYKLLIEFNIAKETNLINLINSKLINI